MTETFSPIKAPGFPSKKTTNFRVRKVDFGDGQVQTAQDGLNASTVSYDLEWPVLSLAEADEIEAFLLARGGWQSFYYTVPNDNQRKYRSGPVTRAYDSSGVTCSLSVTITESHDP